MALRLVALAALALALVVADAQLALVVAPALLVALLPLTGRFLGEDLIVARRAPRPTARRRPRDRRLPATTAAIRSSLERSPRTERGPPVRA